MRLALDLQGRGSADGTSRGSYFERFSFLHCILPLSGEKGPLLASFAWRLPLGNSLCGFMRNLQIFCIFFFFNLHVCPVLLVLFILLARLSHIQNFWVLSIEAVFVKDTNDSVQKASMF